MSDDFGIKGTNEKPTTPRPNINMVTYCKTCNVEKTDKGSGLRCYNGECSEFNKHKGVFDSGDKATTPQVIIEPPSTHDKVEIMVVLRVKFNVKRDHDKELSQHFIQGMIHSDQSADHIGDKAVDRITGMFEMAMFDVQDAECKAQVVEAYSEGIIIDEAKELAEAEAEDTPEKNPDKKFKCSIGDCKEYVRYDNDYCKKCLIAMDGDKLKEHTFVVNFPFNSTRSTLVSMVNTSEHWFLIPLSKPLVPITSTKKELFDLFCHFVNHRFMQC